MSTSQIDEVAESFDAEARARASRLEDIAGGLFALFALAAALMLIYCCAGCANTGTYAVVGDVSAPVDVSDASDSFTVRAFFSLRGAKAWSARNSRTKVTYTNNYTNAYLFGMVDARGVQEFAVEVEPTVDEAADEAADEAESTSATDSRDRESETPSDEPPGDR